MDYKTIQRVETHIVREGEKGIKIGSPEHIVRYMADLQNSDIEKLMALYLDNQNCIICEAVISMGTVDAAPTYPREIIKVALLVGAVSIILVHNHPSGLMEASQDDRATTSEVKAACKILRLHLLDHIIISGAGDGKYYSFADHSLI